MALIHPLALALLGAGLVPLLIHLLVRRRGRRVEFPTLRFLVASPARRLAFGRLSHPSLLAARILIIALLALFLAQPYRTGSAGAQRMTSVVVLDDSASLQAGDSRDVAQEAARAVLAQMGPDQRAALVVYRGTAHVAADLGSPAACLQALEATAAEAGDDRSDAGSGHGAAALQALRLLQGTTGQREVVWISDFRGAGFEDLRRRAAHSGVAWISVPVSHEALANDAPAAVRVEEDGGRKLRLWVDRFSAEGARGEELSWELDSSVPQRVSGVLSDGRGVHAQLSREGPDYRITVALDPGDVLDADDAAAFRVPARAAVRLAVLGPDSELVARALQSAIEVDGLGLMHVASPGQADLLVVSDLASASRAVRREVAGARERGAALVLGGALRSQGVQRRLASVQFAGLEDLLPVAAHRRPPLETAALPEPPEPGRVLARFEDGSVAATRGSARGGEIALGFPLTGPPRGPGLESWFPALVEGLALEVVPQAAPSLAVRSAQARRESALTEPTPPEGAPAMEAAWVDPVALEQETGLALPLAGLLLLAALAEGLLARRASVRS